MALFTSETAAEMAARAHEARKKGKEERALILASPPLIAELVPDHIQGRMERTRKQIELCDGMIDQCDDADQLDALTRSKERLFRIWARLAQLPMDPKPAVVKTRAASYPALDPRPIEPVAAQPVPTTNSVPTPKPSA